MIGAAALTPRRFGAMGESGAELVISAMDRFVRDRHITLKQQLVDVAQARTEAEIPANCAADDNDGGNGARGKAIWFRSSLLVRRVRPTTLATDMTTAAASVMGTCSAINERLPTERFTDAIVSVRCPTVLTVHLP
jgi:hypothetical protein